MAHTIRGDGLYEAHRALEALIEDPQRLDRARERFSKSPLYKSDLSLDSTRSQSTEPLSEEQRQREERKWQLILEHRASFPSSQFDAQRREEEQRILKADEIDHGWFLVDKMRLADAKVRKLARETVKKRWVEQGIWSDRWKDACPWKWKHEEPLELEPGLDTSTERRTALEWEREQSRPYYQFLYEVSKERERMETESPTASISPDINTHAYETVRSIWTKRNIWNRKWRLLPGMSWTHEQPLEQMLAEEMGPQPLSQSPSPSYTSRSHVHEDRASTSSQQLPARRRRYTSYTSEQKQRRMRSPKNKLTQPAADKVLELHGPAKISKARTRKKGGSPGRKNISEPPFNVRSSSYRSNSPSIFPMPDPAPSRKSRRLQGVKSEMPTDHTTIGSTGSARVRLPKPKKTTSDSARPMGIVKALRSRTRQLKSE